MTHAANNHGTASKQRRIIMLLLGAGLGLMLAGTASYFTENPGLISHVSIPQSATASDTAGMPTSAASGASAQSPQTMSPEAQKALMELMQRIKDNPTDTEALLNLAEHFMHMNDWSKAENFALRAVAAAPQETRPLYLLGIIQHNQDRNAEAAANLEKVAAKNNDPSVRYSLGMLYAYYLNDIPKGLAELQKALDTPSISPDLKKVVTDEIAKAKAHATHVPATKE